MASDQIALALRGISKQFNGVPALRDVSLALGAGKVTGLIGQNGAGKSTLIKILAGIYRCDFGEIEVRGEAVSIATPNDARRLGIEIVHQDRLLAPTLTVAEALLIGNERTFGLLPVLHGAKMRQVAHAAVNEHFGIDIDPGRLIAELTVAEQQVVQMTRALMSSPRVLVFDEPTAALARHEAERLFSAIRRLRARGLAILYVSHYLDEVQALCDNVTVLRDGRDVARFDVQATSAQELVAAMIGGAVQTLAPASTRSAGAPILHVAKLSAPGRFDDVSFNARRGEIVGVTGLIGSGGKAVVQSLFGLEDGVHGTIMLDGAPFLPRKPQDAVRRGVAFVPEDRRAHGIALDLSVRENLSLASLGRLVRRLVIDRGREDALVKSRIDELQVRAPGPEAPARHLSGGNQQKVVLAKWLSTEASLYLLDEPSVGVDIGAKAEIYRVLDGLAAQGAAVLLFSTDLIELLGITDRILVMARGALVKELVSTTTTHQEILGWATAAAMSSRPNDEAVAL
jgi:ribose transport system ATP-binding protein